MKIIEEVNDKIDQIMYDKNYWNRLKKIVGHTQPSMLVLKLHLPFIFSLKSTVS